MLHHYPAHPGPAQRMERLPMQEPTPIVYVVDDDISVRESLELLIRSAGWRPVLFDAATAFLDEPASVAPSCLVLDVNLPDLNGLDLQRQIADLRTRAIPAVVEAAGLLPRPPGGSPPNRHNRPPRPRDCPHSRNRRPSAAETERTRPLGRRKP